MPQTTVSGILTRMGMGRLGRLGREPARRYERRRPGELVHVDVKKLGRIQLGAVCDRVRCRGAIEQAGLSLGAEAAHPLGGG